MAKQKTAYVCEECGAHFAKWQGQCGECGVWNRLVEVRLGTTQSNRGEKYEGYAGVAGGGASVQVLSEIDLQDVP